MVILNVAIIITLLCNQQGLCGNKCLKFALHVFSCNTLLHSVPYMGRKLTCIFCKNGAYSDKMAFHYFSSYQLLQGNSTQIGPYRPNFHNCLIYCLCGWLHSGINL